MNKFDKTFTFYSHGLGIALFNDLIRSYIKKESGNYLDKTYKKFKKDCRNSSCYDKGYKVEVKIKVTRLKK